MISENMLIEILRWTLVVDLCLLLVCIGGLLLYEIMEAE